MGAATLQQMADRVAELLEQRLRIKGKTLDDKLRKAGRRLPRKVYAAAQLLAQAAQMSKNPRLMMQVNEPDVVAAYDICLRHLGAKQAASLARKNTAMSIGASIAGSILVLTLLVLGVLRWRGYL